MDLIEGTFIDGLCSSESVAVETDTNNCQKILKLLGAYTLALLNTDCALLLALLISHG